MATLTDTTLKLVRQIKPLLTILIVLGRYCVPDPEVFLDTALSTFKNNFYNQFHIDKLTDYIVDLY